MSTSIPPRDGESSGSASPRLPLADESALRSVFLAEHRSLAEEARAQLGTDAAALIPKVVEGAFVRAWDARTRLKTQEELHSFLIEDVHHASARALSRRMAAHRLAGHDTAGTHAAHAVTEVDPEQSWQHILHGVHGEGHSPQALAAAAAISRHEAAGHIVVATKEQSLWKLLAVGAVALALLVAGAYWVDHIGADSRLETAVKAQDARVVTSLPAQIGVMTLGEGTKVRLAPESKLFIPADFGPKLRAVRLEGAATFDVAKGLDREFRVYARGTNIVATGTSFTVRAYADDPATTVVVHEGAVQVRHANSTQDVAANHAVFVPDSAAARAASAAEREMAEGWQNGVLVLTDQPLRAVLPQLKRWYGLDVTVPTQTLLERKVTMRASLDSTRQALRAIEESTGLEFGYVGQQMVFKEKAAKKGK